MKNPKPHASGRSFHRPPASAPNSSQKPPNSSQKTLNSSQKPPNSSHKPPNSSQKPPNSSQKPPNSSHKPPNSSQKTPNSSQKPPSSAPNSSFKPSSSGNPRPNPSKRGKSRWESPSKSKPPPFSSSPAILPQNQNQNPKTPPILPPPVAVGPTFSLPPPPQPYGFQNLDRRTIVLIDGTVRSYFALPPEEPVIDPFGPPGHGRPGLGIDPYTRRPGLQPHPLDEPSIGKRKYNGEEDEVARQRILQYGNPNPNPNLSQLGDRDNLRVSKHAKIDDRADSSNNNNSNNNNNNNRRLLEVDKRGVRKSFLKFVRVFYENGDLKKKYMANGRNGPLPCLACTRASKEYRDAHELIIHSYNSSQNQEDQINHLGLHKALCVLMGWNYENAPDNNKSYQVLSPEKAQANRDDIILWPPTIIIHNTSFGRKNKDGRFEGFSNKDMDNILKDLGFPGGKARSIYSREGHMGITCVQFANTELGLNEATKLSHYFERQNHDRIGWIRVRPVKPSEDDDRNPNLVKKDEMSGEKKRVLYGYMASVADLDVVDVDIKKRAGVKSKKDFDLLD